MLIFRSAKTGISELALNASYRMHVNSTIGSSAPFTTKSPPPQPVAHRRAGVTLLSRLHVESSRSSAQHLFSLHGHQNKSLKNSSPLFFNFFFWWAHHDVQEAEEGELQRARQWTIISGQRHLFPLVKVRQLQDYGLTQQLLGGL